MASLQSVVTLRRAGLDDIPAIVAVQARSWRSSYRGLVADSYLDALPLQDWMASWRAHLFGARGETLCLVAESGGRVVGFASAGPADGADLDRTVGEVHTIYIDATYYGTGLGRRLMEALLEFLRGQHHTEAVLWVLVGNERAKRFYERGGWRAEGVTASDCWGATQVARERYRLALTPPGDGADGSR